ncbi:MAG: flavin-containing monooxygenase [Panacagrimonas sp.]
MFHTQEQHDVLIIGAGLSGIGMACHLSMQNPNKRIAILERRESLGGTWDLFRYPGIRSDSDMFTMGFGFRPWRSLKVLADGPAIREYLTDTAREHGVHDKIQYGLKVLRSDWSSADRRWTVTAKHEASGETRQFHARFVVMCTGYYNYDGGHEPPFPGIEQFRGTRIHPQFWPENLDYTGKRVVVIGSGATAVTLVPAMADKAAHVTMLQRSPSYVFALPNYDKITEKMLKVMPAKWAYAVTRWRNTKFLRWSFKAARLWPQAMRKLLQGDVARRLGPDFDMRHFTPSYKPWDQRMCAVPDGDLFKTLRGGKASVVTDRIERFTPDGIQLVSGQVLPADIVVTATGLELQALGGMEVRVDGKEQRVTDKKLYKAVLIEDLPNMALIVGYTNISWTMKADIASAYICRLLQHLDAKGLEVATAVDSEGCTSTDSIFGSLSSGYVQRAKDRMLRQGTKAPWQVTHHYETDKAMLTEAPIDDGVLQFSRGAPVAAQPATLARAA